MGELPGTETPLPKTVGEIYQALELPPNLTEHMLRVCAVVSCIQEHWSGPVVDWAFTKKLALLHDVGNVVKFNLDAHPEFLGEAQDNIEYWKAAVERTRARYGTDDHEATKQMLTEMGVNVSLIETIMQKSFGKSKETLASKNWPLIILAYADYRVLPLGIGTLTARMEDIRSRMPWYTTRPDFEELVTACQEMEREIQKHLQISVDDITLESATIDLRNLQIVL